jgi:glutamate-ammonia-ligase adenylyltransferase
MSLLCHADHSRFVQRVRRRYPAELALLADGLPNTPRIESLIDVLMAQGRSLESALRVARHVVIERLAVLDVEQAAAMEDITQAMTHLAEVTLNIALQHARAQLDARHGAPRTAQGTNIDFWVIGMGKLGARELNVSSDIDLIYVYEEDGHTTGPQPLSAHEYFAKLARELYALIGTVTDDGQVFRVDLALRPNGNSGPAAVSMAMLEEYLQVQGREWERFAWLKSRVVAPRASIGNGRALPLRSLVTAFVYRRYLDYGVFESLRQLHRKVREEAQRRAAGRPERADDVKLSRGGIREIEFIVQLLLVVRGGQFPEMRTRSTLRALSKLSAAGLMKADKAAELAEAYTFLRRLEHRIQFLDDQQTHLVPTAEADLHWIALSMGYAPGERPPACQLLGRLGEIRELVATEFDALLHDGRSPPTAGNPCRGGNCGAAEPADAEAMVDRLPPELAERVRPWLSHPRIAALKDDSRQRLFRLVGRSAHAVADGRCTLEGAVRFIDWMEPLLRRESYLALMVERPEVQQRLLRLLGLARWPMRYLMQHPGVIDELADERLVHSRFVAADYLNDLQARHAAWQRSGQADEESLLDTLRRAHHAEVFRTLVRDVEGHITVEEVADELSALADATLQLALQWSWQHLRQAHRSEPRLGIIAYGKLGGKELGYGGDLDVVFVYDDGPDASGQSDDADRAAEAYAAHVRKLINWLTLRTSAGGLFDIDTALRPNGSSGLLVTSMSAFAKYQVGRGSNAAWTWEHQAITRARFCAGWEPLRASFDSVREQVLQAPREATALLREVQDMREKVRAAQPRPRPGQEATFDIKHSPGGMMDTEFAVQALVLLHSRAHPELLGNVGNIALLERAEAAGLLAPGVGHAGAGAYRELRRAQHKARLDEKPPQLLASQASAFEQAGLALWQAVFLQNAPHADSELPLP